MSISNRTEARVTFAPDLDDFDHPDLGSDRIEDLDLGFYKKVADGYRALAQREPQRVKLIDASGSREETFARIQKELRHAFSTLPR